MVARTGSEKNAITFALSLTSVASAVGVVRWLRGASLPSRSCMRSISGNLGCLNSNLSRLTVVSAVGLRPSSPWFPFGTASATPPSEESATTSATKIRILRLTMRPPRAPPRAHTTTRPPPPTAG